MDLAVLGRPIPSLVAEDRSTDDGVRDQTGPRTATLTRTKGPERLSGSSGRAWNGLQAVLAAGSLVLPPPPGWRDLAGRCWLARPPAASAPPSNPAPEPSPLGNLIQSRPTSLAPPLAPGGLSACHGVHRPPVPRAGQTARPGNRKGRTMTEASVCFAGS
jgi:hypothetical protein